jgi:hypothetical protein
MLWIIQSPSWLKQYRQHIDSITEKRPIFQVTDMVFLVGLTLPRFPCVHKKMASKSQGSMLLCSHLLSSDKRPELCSDWNILNFHGGQGTVTCIELGCLSHNWVEWGGSCAYCFLPVKINLWGWKCVSACLAFVRSRVQSPALLIK